MKFASKALIFLLLWVLAASISLAQVPPSSEGSLGDPTTQVSGLPIDQLPPGARALGLGGAFTAVADDATAALANPAGLTNLSAPEVSVFIRNTDADVRFLDPDAFNSGLNAFSGQTDKMLSDSSTDISFASFVIPMEGWVVSGFYSNQLNFSSPQVMDDVYFDGVTRTDDFGGFQFLDRYTNFQSVDSQLENYGISLAFRVSDRFSIGLTARNSQLDLNSVDQWGVDWWNDIEWDIASFLADPDFATLEQAREAQQAINDSYVYRTGVNGSETDLALDFGAYYRGDQWSFGVTYRDGSDFEFDSFGSRESGFSCNAGFGDYTSVCESLETFLDENPDIRNQNWPNFTEQGTSRVRLPSVWSFGVAWRPAETWLIAFDANHNEYSVLNSPRSVTLGFGLDINNESERQTYFDDNVRALVGPVTEPISDEMTYHLGLEKAFVFDSGFLRTLAVRGGAFTIADHDGVVATDYDETVWTLGLGSTWGKSELGASVIQVDIGASFADDVTNIVLSGIYRF